MSFSSFLLESAFFTILVEGQEEANRGPAIGEIGATEISARMAKHINTALDRGYHIDEDGNKIPINEKDIGHSNRETSGGYHPAMEAIRQQVLREFSRKSGPNSYKKGIKEVQHFRTEQKKHSNIDDNTPNGVFNAYASNTSHEEMQKHLEAASHMATHHLIHTAGLYFKKGSRYGQHFWTNNEDKLDDETGIETLGDPSKIRKKLGLEHKIDPFNTSDFMSEVVHPNGKSDYHGCQAKVATARTNYKQRGLRALETRAGLEPDTLVKLQKAHVERLVNGGIPADKMSQTDLGKYKKNLEKLASGRGKKAAEARQLLEFAESSKKQMLDETAKAYTNGLQEKSKNWTDEQHKEHILNVVFPPSEGSYSVVGWNPGKGSDHDSVKSIRNPTDELREAMKGYDNFRIVRRGNQTVHIARNIETGEDHDIVIDGKKTNNSWHKHRINSTTNVPVFEGKKQREAREKLEQRLSNS